MFTMFFLVSSDLSTIWYIDSVLQEKVNCYTNLLLGSHGQVDTELLAICPCFEPYLTIRWICTAASLWCGLGCCSQIAFMKLKQGISVGIAWSSLG